MPGPQSQEDSDKFLLRMVKLDIPPMFKKIILSYLLFGVFIILYLFVKSLWNIGVKGAPSPPFLISFFLKLKITFFLINCDSKYGSPI